MHFVRDSDAVGAILAGAGSRPAEELVTALRKGGYLRKYGRFGKPKQHWFRLSHDDKELLWDSSNGKVRSISLLSVSKIVQGQTTPVFRREPLPDYEAVSFSLLYIEGRGGGKERSLDLVCRNMQEFETWFLGIQLVIVLNQNHALQQQQRQQQQQAATNGQAPAAALRSHSGSGNATPLRRQPSGTLSPRASDDKQLVDRIQEFKQIAASLQPVKAALTSGASSQRGASGQAALAAAASTKREIGDCYIWGSWLGDAEASGLDLADGALQCCGQPSMVTNTHALDVIQVAVGARHAALTTRGGEVYTWGAGAGGNMGNGTSAGSNYPQQVTRLAGKGTAAVACGHSYTAAVLTDGALYSWGTGLGGQLGLGPSVTAAVWPTRIMAGLEGVRVSQVSCGPYHAAAIGSDGRLFTWGDGLFGKLGHGDHCSAASPRFVTTLAEHWVISVSCGWWHTAAAAVARARLTGRGVNSSTSLDSSFAGDAAEGPASASAMRRTASNSGSFLRGNIVGTSPAPTPEVAPSPAAVSPAATAAAAAAAAGSSSRELPTASVLASRAADMGGAIFTWGGDFRWQQQTPWAKDNHQGCLGVGDLSGRLVPTLVKGEDNHVQVACGLNFTVALTNSGEVFQMGSTGAHNSKEKDKADWRSALVPVLVRGPLSSHTAERLACGMSHVAVVATQRSKANSSSGSTPVTRLLTWGRNTAGQLGIGAGREDHFLPQIVSAVAGRRILFLTCGGNYTLAVCEHDPRTRWSRDSLLEDGSHGLGLASAASGSLVSGSGPSRMHLAGAGLTPGGGSGGGPGAAAFDRALAAAGSGGAGTTPAGGQRAAAGGGGGLNMSASLSSLASSVQSGSRGEGGGSGGGSGLAHKSDRGRLESRYSDRGFPVQAGGCGSGKEQQAATPSSKGLAMLTRSLDLSRSVGGAGVGGAAQQQQQGSAGNHVSWAPSSNDPSSSSRSLLRMGNSSKGFGGSFSSSSPSRAAGGNSSGLQLQDLSLQTLAGASKRGHHLPLPKSFKRLASMGRSDSNNSSSSSRAANWADWQQQSQHHHQGGSGHTRGPGVMGDAQGSTSQEQQQQQQRLSYGRTSSRQLSYSARSDQDLATVSVTSSLTSAALSVTPSPSLHSMQEGRGVEGGGLTPGEGQAAGGDDFHRQLRYWQERATNMEQQLSRRTHELESLRRELRFSSTSQGTAASDSTQHYSCSSLRPLGAGGSDRRSSGGGSTGAGGGSAGGGSSSLAARRGLQSLPPVITGAGVWAQADREEGPAGSSSEAALGLTSQDSSSVRTGHGGGATTGSASATPAGASSAGASSASAAAAAGALVAAAMSCTPQDRKQQRPQQQQSQQSQEGQQQRPGMHVLGSYPLPALTPEPPVSCPGSDSEDDAMQDAREDWTSPVTDETDRDGHLLPAAADLPAAPGASSYGAAAAATAKGPGAPAALVRDSSLATWMGGDGARVALLWSRGASLANGSSAAASAFEASAAADQAVPLQQQQQVLAPRVPRRSTGESSFVFAKVDRLEQELQQQQQQGAGGLAGLRSASSVTSEDFTVAGSSTAGSKVQQQQQRHSHRQRDVQQQQQQLLQQEQLLLQQQQEMFRGMSEHSKEASRVLALFQESQRNRQQLEQQQQQPGSELPPLPASGNEALELRDAAAGAAPPGSIPLSVGAAAASVAADAASVAGRADGTPAAGDALPLAAGAVDVAAAGGDRDDEGSPMLSPAAARELDLLRQQNRVLQQQQQLPGAGAGAAAAAAASGPPAPVTVVAGRSSFGPGGSSVSGSGLAGALSKHRKTGSVDIGSCPTVTQEVAKGVYLSLQALPLGGYELKRVRFAKQVFSSEDAEQWWATHRERVYAAFNISHQQLAGTGGGSGSSAGRVLVSLANPFPSGGPPANAGASAAASGGGLWEGYAKRASHSIGDRTPPPGPSPCFDASSPQSSTLELETLQLPPSALLDAAFAQAESEQQQQQWWPLLSQQQQQHLMRGWPAICVSADGPTVSRSSSLGPVGAELVAAAAAGVVGGGSKGGPGSSRLSQTAVGDAADPQGMSQQQQQQQGPFVSPASSPAAAAGVLSGAGSGIESVWQPVLPRKMSVGLAAAAATAGAAGPESTSPAAAASSSAGGAPAPGSAVSTSHGHHKRSGSGLFRWLAKQQQQQPPAAEEGGGPSSNGSSSL